MWSTLWFAFPLSIFPSFLSSKTLFFFLFKDSTKLSLNSTFPTSFSTQRCWLDVVRWDFCESALKSGGLGRGAEGTKVDVCPLCSFPSLFFQAVPEACGSSQARDQTCTTPSTTPLCHKGTPCLELRCNAGGRAATL